MVGWQGGQIGKNQGSGQNGKKKTEMKNNDFFPKTMPNQLVSAKLLELVMNKGSKMAKCGASDLRRCMDLQTHFLWFMASKRLILERWGQPHLKELSFQITEHMYFLKICPEMTVWHSRNLSIKW